MVFAQSDDQVYTKLRLLEQFCISVSINAVADFETLTFKFRTMFKKGTNAENLH